MGLIDEYKQAIQDVLDGRAKPAPKPSELPDTDDKLANLWAAAAAELIAETNSGGAVLVVHEVDDALDKTWQEIHDALKSGGAVIEVEGVGVYVAASAYIDNGYYTVAVSYGDYVCNTANGYPVTTG